MRGWEGMGWDVGRTRMVMSGWDGAARRASRIAGPIRELAPMSATWDLCMLVDIDVKARGL
jgi:hypothetical protein